MAKKSDEIGKGVTNPTPESEVKLRALPRHDVTLAFVPAQNGPFKKTQGGERSTDLKGSLLWLRAKVTSGLGSTEMRLPGPTQLVYLESGARKKVTANQIVVKNVFPGDEIDVFFGRSALKEHRQEPLLTIGPIDTHVVVVIFEKPGKHGEDHSLSEIGEDEAASTTYFSAHLTGDNWKACTPPFTADGAKGAVSQAGVDATVATATSRIYASDGLKTVSGGNLALDVDRGTSSKAAPGPLQIIFTPAENPAANIQDYSASADVPTRVHPNAYAAVIQAGLKADLRSVRLSSSWRPMLGSSAHRHGIGLDVASITAADGKEHPLNWQPSAEQRQARDELAKARARREAAAAAEKKARKARDAALKKEKKAVAEAEKARAELAKAAADLASAEAALAALEAMPPPLDKRGRRMRDAALAKARKAKKAASDRMDRAGSRLAKREKEHAAALAAREAADIELAAAEDAAKEARRDEEQKDGEWGPVVKQHAASEPEPVRSFRKELVAASKLVRQVFDPWQMDANTGDAVGATDNQLLSANETLHGNHMHVTARDPALDAFGS